MPVRRQQPVFVPRASYAYKPSRHDYGIDDSINRVEYFSNAVLEDNYDAAAKSRGRDYELLRNANAAIVNTEQHASPRSSAVSRRVRASTAPPAPRSAPVQQAQQAQYSSFTKEGVYYRPANASGSLRASRPPLPKQSDRKAIRDVDGFTKPRNVYSWQYRVESRLSPDDLIYQPSSYIRLREQVRDVQEKMDRQRQLLDRYLDTDNMSTSTYRKDATSKA